MAMPVKTLAPAGAGSFGLDQLKRPTNGTIEAEQARLRKATGEFESFFIYQMLKAMRKTIPEQTLSQGVALDGGLGKDTFTEIFDLEIARKATLGGHNSISELMYKSLEKLIDAQFEKPVSQPEMKRLDQPAVEPLEIDQIRPRALPAGEPQPIRIERSGHGLPLRTVHRRVHSDPIMAQFGQFIEEAAEETKLDSELISSVIRAESNGNPVAVSGKGAKGLMQLIDSTARELKVSDPFDPRENIRAGSRYLRKMLDQFGNLKLALAAYNAGPGNVTKHGGIPPFQETRDYVRRVTGFMESVSIK
jgi:Rod binding domain-containing protein